MDAEDALVARPDGGLGGRAGQVRDADFGVVWIERDRLDRACHQGLGMARKPLVERIVAQHQEAESTLSAPGTTPLLAERRDRTRKAHHNGTIKLADVDTELEGVGRDHGPQGSTGQPRLDLAAHLGRIARPIRLDTVGQHGGTARQLVAHAPQDQLDHLPTRGKADHALIVDHQLGHEADRVLDPRGASPRRLVEQARIPQRNIAAWRRRTIGIDNRDCTARQLPKRLGRVANGGRREQQLGRGAVERSAAAQASNHVRDVAAKDAAIDVSLVDDDRAEARQPLIPALMVRADADVDHVGITEDEIRLDASAAATRGIRIAVDQRHA